MIHEVIINEVTLINYMLKMQMELDRDIFEKKPCENFKRTLIWRSLMKWEN